MSAGELAGPVREITCLPHGMLQAKLEFQADSCFPNSHCCPLHRWGRSGDGSLWPDRLHLAPRSTLWEIEYCAGRVPRLPPLKNYVSHKVLGRYSRGLSGLVVLAHALSLQPPLPEIGRAHV